MPSSFHTHDISVESEEKKIIGEHDLLWTLPFARGFILRYIATMNQTIKILVVENDEIERMVVRVALNQAKVKVELTETGDCQSALSILKSELFECVFLDYCLPDGDGLQLIQQIRGAGIKVPLVVLTGQADDQIAVELMKAGASDYLSKNRVSPDSLSRSLSNAVRIYRAEQEAEKANQQLLISEERYRLVLEGSNDGIWDWEIDTEKIYGNERLWEMLGLSPETLTITPDLFFLPIVRSQRSRQNRSGFKRSSP